MEKEEQVIFKVSRKLYFPFYTMIVLLAFLLIFVKIYGGEISRLSLIGTASFIALGLTITEVHRMRHVYYLTPNYIEHHAGIIARGIKKIHIGSITDIKAQQKIWHRILGFGNIIVQSASGATDISINNINNPNNFIAEFEKRMKVIMESQE